MSEHTILPLDNLHSCVKKDERSATNDSLESVREMMARQWNDSHFAAALLEFGRPESVIGGRDWSGLRQWYITIILEGKREPIDFEVFAFMSEYRLWIARQRKEKSNGR